MPENSILFNCLVNEPIYQPVLSWSNFKAFFAKENIDAKIIYWNILLESIIIKYLGIKHTTISEKSLIFIPLLKELGVDYDKNRLESHFHSIYPEKKFKDTSYFNKIDNEIVKVLSGRINNIIESIDFSQINLIAFPFQKNQWLPSLVIANRIKKYHPNLKIISLGYENNNSALDILEKFKCFDFAIIEFNFKSLHLLYSFILQNNIDFQHIPNLLYRVNGKIIANKIIEKSETDYVEPNFDDYFNSPILKGFAQINIKKIALPVNTTNQLVPFVNNSQSHPISTEEIFSQVEVFTKKYPIRKFILDVPIENHSFNFEKLINLLKELHNTNPIDIELKFKNSPIAANAELIKKMKLSGVNNISIDIDSLTDDLLKKTNKNYNFAEILYFVKFALKYNIKINPACIIIDLPQENFADISESINNIHFLRFFLGLKNKLELTIKKHAAIKYSKNMELTEDEESCDTNLIFSLLQVKFNDRFRLFDFCQTNIVNENEWIKFKNICEYYQSIENSYKIIEDKVQFVYQEFLDGELVKNLSLSRESKEVLHIANEKICSFSEIFLKTKLKFPDLNENQLSNIIDTLKNESILYCNKDKTKVITIIDIPKLNY